MHPLATSVTMNCYILSVSQHQEPNDQDGLLSMWRAYGSGDIRIAAIVRPSVAAPMANAGSFLTPCVYGDLGVVGNELGIKAKAIRLHQAQFASADGEIIKRLAIGITTNFAVSIKHPGFAEEKEWRLVFMPDFPSAEMEDRKEAVVWGGVPQVVYKVPFLLPQHNYYDESTVFLEKIVLGPCNEWQTVRADWWNC